MTCDGFAARRAAVDDVVATERLRRYWMTGEGAAKIRWGEDGDWSRCVRHLSKYLGVRAKGYCTLLHGRVLGQWPGRHDKPPSPLVKARATTKQFMR